MTKVRVSLVDQGVWKMSTVSMPLSLGYIKATAYADPGIRSAADIQICSFRGSATAPEIARVLFSDEPPDILAFSVFGWNLYRFAAIAETYRQAEVPNATAQCMLDAASAVRLDRASRFPGLQNYFGWPPTKA